MISETELQELNAPAKLWQYCKTCKIVATGATEPTGICHQCAQLSVIPVLLATIRELQKREKKLIAAGESIFDTARQGFPIRQWQQCSIDWREAKATAMAEGEGR